MCRLTLRDERWSELEFVFEKCGEINDNGRVKIEFRANNIAQENIPIKHIKHDIGFIG